MPRPYPPEFRQRAVHPGGQCQRAADLGQRPTSPWLFSVSFHADLYEIDGRRYLLDIAPRRGYTRDIRRSHGRGILSYDGTDTEVTFTEVTDRDVKHQVVIAYAAVKPRVILATGEHTNRPATCSFLVIMGLAQCPAGTVPG